MVGRYLLITTWMLATAAGAAPLDSRLGAPDPTAQWRTLSTTHFNIHFEAGQRDIAERVGATAEAAYDRLTEHFDHNPQGKTELVIDDDNDESNGGASPFPYRNITINLRPPDSGDLLGNQDWLEQLLTHEYTHILHQDRVRGVGMGLRRIFGNVDALPLVFAAYPQLWGPDWLAEGLAIRSESLGGQGRDHSAIYAAKMRTELRAGLHSLAQESYEGYNPIRWPFGHVYLYGAWFFQFLDDTWGPEKTQAYLAEYDDNIVPWRMNHRAEAVFGLSSRALWERFEEYLAARFENAAPPTDTGYLADTRWLNRLPTAGPNGSLYFYHADLVGMPVVRRIDPDGRTTDILEATGVRFLDWHPGRGLLIGRQLVCDNRKRYIDVLLLRPGSSTPQRLTRCGRIQQAAWHPDGDRIIGVQLDAGKTRLVEISASDSTITSLFSPPAAEHLGRVALSPDGVTVAMQHYRPADGWKIRLLSLADNRIETITSRPGIETHPRFADDGKTLFYLAHSGDRVELYRLDLDSGDSHRLTHSPGYIDDYAIGDDSRVTVAEYTADGIFLRRLPASPKPLPTVATDAGKETVPLLTTTATHLRTIHSLPDHAYNPLESMRPHSWLPIVELNDAHDSRIGLRLSGRDALGFHDWLMVPLWFDHDGVQRPGGLLSYGYDGRLLLAASRTIVAPDSNDAPVWSDEKRLQLLAQWFRNHRDSGWKLFAGIAYERIDRHNGNLLTTSRDQLIGAGVVYDSLHDYGQSISPTDGIRLSLIGEGYGGDSDHAGNAGIGSFTLVHHLGGNHHLFGRLTGGSGDNRIKPFVLGGDENVLDDISGITPLGQRRFSVRGYADGAVGGGNRFVRATAEWRFPLATIYSGLLAPPVGLGRLHGALFADSAVVDQQAGKDDWLTGVGIELTTDLLIGFDSFSIPLTLGFAKGLDEEKGDERVYLRAGFGF